MPKKLFDLTESDVAALEAIRKNRGHRSHAETLRELIRNAASSGLPTPEVQAQMKAAVIDRQKAARKPVDAKPIPGSDAALWKAAEQEMKRAREMIPSIGSLSGVPLAGTFERKPYQKGAKK